MYGLMLAIGVLVAVRVAGRVRRWVRREADTQAKEFSDIVVLGRDRRASSAPALYHVITDYQLFDGRPASARSRSGRAASASGAR